jgi:hypothetical protein
MVMGCPLKPLGADERIDEIDEQSETDGDRQDVIEDHRAGLPSKMLAGHDIGDRKSEKPEATGQIERVKHGS